MIAMVARKKALTKDIPPFSEEVASAYLKKFNRLWRRRKSWEGFAKCEDEKGKSSPVGSRRHVVVPCDRVPINPTFNACADMTRREGGKAATVRRHLKIKEEAALGVPRMPDHC